MTLFIVSCGDRGDPHAMTGHVGVTRVIPGHRGGHFVTDGGLSHCWGSPTGDMDTREGTGTAGMAPGEGDRSLEGMGTPQVTRDKGHVPVSCCEYDRLVSPCPLSPVPAQGVAGVSPRCPQGSVQVRGVTRTGRGVPGVTAGRGQWGMWGVPRVSPASQQEGDNG